MTAIAQIEIDTVAAATITSLVSAREEQRRANPGNFLVPPPIPVQQFSLARMEPIGLGSTHSLPNEQMRLMRVWLQEIFSVNGSRADLSRAWESWQTQFRSQKGPLATFYEELCLAADTREQLWSKQLGEEGRLGRNADMARARVQALQFEEARAAKELSRIRTQLAERKAELADAEAAMRAGNDGT